MSYSHLFNKRGGWNKREGGAKVAKSLNVEVGIFWKKLVHTVVCRIVRRLLISVHKWQFSGMADTHKYCSQHSAHLVYSPIFHGLNLIISS